MLNKDKFSAISGLTEASAKKSWNILRKKIVERAGDGTPATPGDGKKKTPASKRKAKADEQDGENVETPSKKPRGKKQKAAATHTAEEDDGAEAQVVG